MGVKHPLLLIPDLAAFIGVYIYFQDHFFGFLSATYFVVGIAVAVKQLFTKAKN